MMGSVPATVDIRLPRFGSPRPMARKVRGEYPGAIYHVMNRGNRREPIFRADVDRKRFLETLAEACVKEPEH